MVDLKTVKSVTKTLASELGRALASDRRTAGLLPVRRGIRGINDHHTGGYWVQLGRLDRSTSVELWLDHYSGLTTPRVWIGFRSASPEKLLRIVRLAKRAGFRKPPVTKTSSNISSARPYHFLPPLRSSEMGVLVLEKYPRWRSYYLGMYLSYSWPIPPRIRQAIVRDAINLIGSFTDVWAQSDRGAKLISPGLWARPNPATPVGGGFGTPEVNRLVERAAVKFVTRCLSRRGYSVVSREIDGVGYDLDARKGSKELHVEVKGISADTVQFPITSNELKRAKSDNAFLLMAVTGARKRRPKLHKFRGDALCNSFTFTPLAYQAEKK